MIAQRYCFSNYTHQFCLNILIYPPIFPTNKPSSRGGTKPIQMAVVCDLLSGEALGNSQRMPRKCSFDTIERPFRSFERSFRSFECPFRSTERRKQCVSVAFFSLVKQKREAIFAEKLRQFIGEYQALTLKNSLYVFKHTNFVEIICHLPKNIFLTLRSEIEVCSFYSTTQSVYPFSVRV